MVKRARIFFLVLVSFSLCVVMGGPLQAASLSSNSNKIAATRLEAINKLSMALDKSAIYFNKEGSFYTLKDSFPGLESNNSKNILITRDRLNNFSRSEGGVNVMVVKDRNLYLANTLDVIDLDLRVVLSSAGYNNSYSWVLYNSNLSEEQRRSLMSLGGVSLSGMLDKFKNSTIGNFVGATGEENISLRGKPEKSGSRVDYNIKLSKGMISYIKESLVTGANRDLIESIEINYDDNLIYTNTAPYIDLESFSSSNYYINFINEGILRSDLNEIFKDGFSFAAERGVESVEEMDLITAIKDFEGLLLVRYGMAIEESVSSKGVVSTGCGYLKDGEVEIVMRKCSDLGLTKS